MAEIVNLRQVRKRHARAEKEKQAEVNRTKFGRSKAEQQAAERTKTSQETVLSGKRLSSDGEDD